MLGQHDAALVDFTEAIDGRALVAAEQARALYDRGVALDELGRTEDAAGDYTAALRLAPGFAAAFNNRGNAYRRLGRLAEARADYRASIAAKNPHPEYPDYGLGQVAEAQGQLDAARGYYRAALAASPQFTPASASLAALMSPAADIHPSSAATDIRPLPAATDIHSPPADAGTIHLRPPGRSAVPEPSAEPSADQEIHLIPPGQAVIHLRPPRSHALPLAPDLDLKPTIAEVGQTVRLGTWRSKREAAAD